MCSAGLHDIRQVCTACCLLYQSTSHGRWSESRWKAAKCLCPCFSQSELEFVPQILLSIAKAKVRRMQLALQGVWHRFMWSRLPIFAEVLQATCIDAAEQSKPGQQTNACNKPPDQDDAFDTIMQWLAART